MRQFKALKRQELMAIVKAVEVFRLGCTYTPSYPSSINRLQIIMQQMQQELSVKQWGR